MTALSSIQLNRVRYPNHPNWYKKTGGTRINGNSFANLPGQITTKSTLISPNAPAAAKRAQAIYNTNTALGIAAMRAGDYDLAKTYMEAAAATIDEYLRVYCGADRAHLDDIHNVAGSLSLPLTLVPILGSYNDFLYYATEGNGPMTALFALFFVADAVTLGGVTLAKLGITGGKLVAGAGMKEAVKEVAGAASKYAHTSPSKLEKNMIAAGEVIPDYPYNAHHIVAKGSPNADADASREILKKWGIDINDVSNGVFLPVVKDVPGSYHPSLHSNEYYRSVYERLSTAKTREDVLAELGSIKRDLLNGVY